MITKINIEVISDFACPWCFVGKRHLDKAIDQRGDLVASVSWRPYQLNPDMPRGGRNRREYYRNKFGEAGAGNLWQSLRAAGAGEGIVFCDAPDAMAPNTLSAHVLMSWASEEEGVAADALAEKLFHAHHEACENIGDHDVLTRIAEEVGMDGAGVASKLAAGSGEHKVTEQIQLATARGVSAVPFFVINERYALSGAQPVDVLISAFDDLSKTDET
jgi:predicted DsbA family dithiol-disulfide isomerase